MLESDLRQISLVALGLGRVETQTPDRWMAIRGRRVGEVLAMPSSPP